MSPSTSDPLIAAYIGRAQREARGLPRARREELVQQLEEHLRDAVPPGATEADIRNALERLGEPESIVAEEFDRLGIRRATAGKLEWARVGGGAAHSSRPGSGTR